MEEVQLKAANKMVKKVKTKTAKANEEKQKKEVKLTKEEAQQAAMNYIMMLIKRDSKPTNPETMIMIKLFEKMADTRAKKY